MKDTTSSKTRSPRKAGAPTGPRKADYKRAVLVETAKNLFEKNGYETTSMDEIAAAANVAKGTLYHYFSNKSVLLLAVREDFEREIISRIVPNVEKIPVDDVKARLMTWIDCAISAYIELHELHDLVIYGQGMPFRNAMADAEITKYLTKLIDDGAKSGAWTIDNPHLTATLMFYCFRGGCDEAIIGTMPLEDISNKLKEVFLRTLGV